MKCETLTNRLHTPLLMLRVMLWVLVMLGVLVMLVMLLLLVRLCRHQLGFKGTSAASKEKLQQAASSQDRGATSETREPTKKLNVLDDRTILSRLQLFEDTYYQQAPFFFRE